MRSALKTQKKKGVLNAPDNAIDNYNGVDVDNLYKSKRNDHRNKKFTSKESQRKLSRYLTKYITKNDIKFNRLPWHCSRDVSALFTSALFDEDEYNAITLLVRERPELFKKFTKEEIEIYIPLFDCDLRIYSNITEINNKIFDMVNKKT